MSHIIKIDSLLHRKRFVLDHLVFEKGGFFGKIVPLLIAGVFLLLGYMAGIFGAGVQPAAKTSYIFWILFIAISMYLLYFFDLAGMQIVHEAELKLDITSEKHEKILKFIYGPIGIIIWLLITAPFIIYDITGFSAVNTEGWLNDIKLSMASLDETWYPGILSYPNGIGFSTLLWLVVWEIPWLYFGAFIWLSLANLVYVNRTLKNSSWREDIDIVVRKNRYKHLLNHLFELYVLLVPYLLLKLIYQLFLDIWWDDTIATFVLFAIFFVGIAISPFLITSDVNSEKLKLLENIESIETKAFDDTGKDLISGKDVDTKFMIKALIIHLYAEEMTAVLTSKSGSKGLVIKIVFALVGPIAGYAIKFVLPLLGL